MPKNHPAISKTDTGHFDSVFFNCNMVGYTETESVVKKSRTERCRSDMQTETGGVTK